MAGAVRTAAARRAVAALALAAASAVVAGLLGAADADWPDTLGLLPIALALVAGAVGGAFIGCVAVLLAYVAAGFYLGATHPSVGLCMFECADNPITFDGTASVVWMAGVALSCVAAFGGALTTAYRRAALLAAVIAGLTLGLLLMFTAPERWHDLGWLLIPLALPFCVVFLVQELRRAGKRSRGATTT